MNSLFWNIAGISIFDLVAVYFAKFYSINKNPWFLILTCGFFTIAALFFVRSLQYEGLAIVNILWTSISVILVTISGYFIFKEHITPLQFLGIALTIIGLVLIEIKK